MKVTCNYDDHAKEIDQIKKRLGKGNLFTDEHVQILLSHISTIEGLHFLDIQIIKDQDAEEKLLRERVKRLQEAIDRHKQSILTEELSPEYYDEELYKVRDLESDLKLDASMLAKQCDLTREVETEREHLSTLLIEERRRVVELRDAISKHEKFKRTHNNVVALEDEELYRTKKEIIGKMSSTDFDDA